jgi:aldehyde dehydrogenase (NAD+)
MTHPFRAAGGGPRGARTPAPASTLDSIPRTVAGLRSTFASGRTRPLAWRRRQLAALARLVREHERDFAAALAEDLGRGPVDTWLADLAPVAAEARWTSRRLAGWTRPARVRTPLGIRPGRSWSEPEPLGVVLIIGPWNYPVQLVLAPLVGAIAAGNCAVIKPSERTPATSQLLARLVPRYLDPAAFAVIVGGAAESEAVLAEGVDHCLFTGGADAGRAVMTSAAARLTPSRSNSAAKARSSWRRTPTSRWPPGASPGPSCSTPARPASRPTMSWCTGQFAIASSNTSAPRSRR